MQIVMKLYIIAGEKSGDIHGALLLKNLLRLMPGMEVAGLGGQGMHALCPGVEDWADEAAVIGVVEVLKKYGWFRRSFLSILERIRQDQPEGPQVLSPHQNRLFYLPAGVGMASRAHSQDGAHAGFDDVHLPF